MYENTDAILNIIDIRFNYIRKAHKSTFPSTSIFRDIYLCYYGENGFFTLPGNILY